MQTITSRLIYYAYILYSYFVINFSAKKYKRLLVKLSFYCSKPTKRLLKQLKVVNLRDIFKFLLLS